MPRSQLDNALLVTLLQETALADRRAFEQLYQLTSPFLMGLSYRLLRDKGLAEEALQEAFIHIWYKANEYRADCGAVFPWIAAIVRYRSLDILRRETTLSGRQQSFDELTDVLFYEDAEQGADHLAVSQLQACLAALESSQRKSLLLTYYYGLSNSDLVNKLKSPLGTIKSWIRRGMQRVRECMQS
jgi:RNA polymerase sigma-70 factor (ECF subfamily)